MPGLPERNTWGVLLSYITSIASFQPEKEVLAASWTIYSQACIICIQQDRTLVVTELRERVCLLRVSVTVDITVLNMIGDSGSP